MFLLCDYSLRFESRHIRFRSVVFSRLFFCFLLFPELLPYLVLASDTAGMLIKSFFSSAAIAASGFYRSQELFLSASYPIRRTLLDAEGSQSTKKTIICEGRNFSSRQLLSDSIKVAASLKDVIPPHSSLSGKVLSAEDFAASSRGGFFLVLFFLSLFF